MIEIHFSKSFDRLMRKIESEMLESISEKIEEFREKDNHQRLKVHKLKGRLAGFYAFSIDYKYRIVFQWLSSNSALLLDFGDHSVYE